MHCPTSRPCPRCGGTDRFFYIAQPRNGSPPFWLCRQCRYTEHAPGDGRTTSTAPLRTLTDDERQRAATGYTAAACWCADQLFTPAGAAARAYLHQRGFTDATLRDAQIGWYPDEWRGALYADLWRRDPEHARTLGLTGLTAAQGRPKTFLRGSITLPYAADGVSRMLRTRKLQPAAGQPTYCSPAGVALYAGSASCFFLHDVLAQTDAVILTEGEFKALACWQAWRAGALSMPAVATPGIGYLPDDLIAALAGKTVYLAYDVEQRRDPFVLSPGETFTIRNGERLTGIGIPERLDQLTRRVQQAAKLGLDVGEVEHIQQQIEQGRERLHWLHTLQIPVRVVRLPRPPECPKTDLDSVLLEHGPETLQTLLTHAPDFDRWHARHGSGPYRFGDGTILNCSRQIANYQAILTDDVLRVDGETTHVVHRLALTSAGSQGQRTIDVPTADWMENRKAVIALRTGLCDGTALDVGQEVITAVKLLSLLGDGPTRRTEYTATGWQQIDQRWHYLMPDGAISASGISRTVRASLPSGMIGNHYALCGPGDADQGAAAFMDYLRGACCPQALAILLASHAALTVIHTFLNDSNRPLPWLVGESNALKTSLVRAGYLALWGPTFTGAGRDGAPVTKWEATLNGLLASMYTYRDAPVLLDDYKGATCSAQTVARVLHAYSESTGRTRMTDRRTLDTSMPARSLAVATGEDTPQGDTGQQGRIIELRVMEGDIDADALCTFQAAGEAGHLAAFWRTFIQHLAATLDVRGAQTVGHEVRALLRQDEARFPGHRRTVGALQQHRMAWLLLLRYLEKRGILTSAAAQQLDAGCCQAMRGIATQQNQYRREQRPASVFLDVVREALANGDLILDEEGKQCPVCGSPLERADDAYYCRGSRTVGDHDVACTYRIDAQRIVGFTTGDGVALIAGKCYKYVQQTRTAQRSPLQFSASRIYEQLAADACLARVGSDGRPTITLRNPVTGHGARVLLLVSSALFPKPDPDDEPPFGLPHAPDDPSPQQPGAAATLSTDGATPGAAPQTAAPDPGANMLQTAEAACAATPAPQASPVFDHIPQAPPGTQPIRRPRPVKTHDYSPVDVRHLLAEERQLGGDPPTVRADTSLDRLNQQQLDDLARRIKKRIAHLRQPP